MNRAMQNYKEAEQYEERAKYWESKSDIINLSMPESLEFYQFKVEEARKQHEGLKNGSIPKSHGYSLTYAKKRLNEMQKNLQYAEKLWEVGR